MTALQRAQLRQSEIRTKIASELGKEEADRDHAELESLTVQAKNIETEVRAALVAGEDSGLPEDTEVARSADDKLVELRSRVDFGEYVDAALAGRGVAGGAEAEYNQELGLKEDFFPLDVLANGVETRAKRDGDASTSQASWIDRVFQNTAAMHLGVSMRSVAPGVAAIPVTTAGGNPKQRGRAEAVSESTYTAKITEIKPARAAVHGIYSIEDTLRLPGLAEAIQRDMRSAMTERIDRIIFVGDSGADETGANVVGLNSVTIGESTITQTLSVNAFSTIKLFTDLIDGQYATMPG